MHVHGRDASERAAQIGRIPGERRLLESRGRKVAEQFVASARAALPLEGAATAPAAGGR